MHTRILPLVLVLLSLSCTQNSSQQGKLLLVISIDQLPYSYLERFSSHFTDGGFRYLQRHGASFSNAEYAHSLNMTAPGHAVILSGTYGYSNGIIANGWYDPENQRDIYCVGDSTVHTVGGSGRRVSPASFRGFTVGDALRKRHPDAKVLSVSLKDRSAVLMGGRSPSGVYWLVDSSFVTSSYYANSLPKWVEEFNRSALVRSYFGATWDRVLPISAYETLDRDDAPYEASTNRMDRVFPHRITGNDTITMTPSYYASLRESPFGNDVLLAFAKHAIRAEGLGKRNVTDLLCLGFSANDYVGHSYGPHSHEALDITVRTDALLADLLQFLDESIGLDHCLMVLTSDHGIAPIPEYMQHAAPGTPSGRVFKDSTRQIASRILNSAYGLPSSPWIAKIIDNNIYLNRQTLRAMRLSPEDAARSLAAGLRNTVSLAAAFTRAEMRSLHPVTVVEERMKRSFDPERSGDVFIALKPYFVNSYGHFGTNHSEPYTYDAHVPIMFMGKGVRKGEFGRAVTPADIAPTLAALLRVNLPENIDGKVLREAFE